MRTLPFSPGDTLRLALLAALGLPAFVACSGTVEMKDGSSSDGGSASGGDTGTGGSTTGGHPGSGGVTSGCTSPVPILPGSDSGFFRCAEGYEHRAYRADCPSKLPRAEEQPAINAGADAYDECDYDSDCPGENAYCTTAPSWGGPASGNVCAKGCINDSQCDPGYICHCGDPVGTCVPAKSLGTFGCNEDADCGPGLLCVNVPALSCGDALEFTCQLPSDECRSPADCMPPGMDCQIDASGRHVCGGQYVCGRPFLIDFMERRAAESERSDWTQSAREPQMAGLSSEVRERLAAHWADIALMEHASIAAFARFSLQLLALGAPADLIEETNRALADETKHARLCFALASSYRGAPVGPGPLDIGRALEGSTPEGILRTVIREGCVGETQAALEAAQAASSAEDPSVKELLGVIAEDEGRHAELAWRFVQWLLREQPALRDVAAQELAQAIHAGSSDGSLDAGAMADTEQLAPFGVLGAAARGAVRERALTRVVAPCASALLSGGSWPAGARAATPVSRSASHQALC